MVDEEFRHRSAEPAETGDTFLANATIKARAYAEQTGLPVVDPLKDGVAPIVDRLLAG